MNRTIAGFSQLAFVVLVVVAVGAIVAIAATGFSLLLPPARLEGVWPLALRVGGAAVAAAALAWLLAQRRRLPPAGEREPDPTVSAIVTAATIMAVLAVTALLAPRLAAVADEASEDESRRVSAEDSVAADSGFERPPGGPPDASRPRSGGLPGGIGGSRRRPLRFSLPGEALLGFEPAAGLAGGGGFQRIARMLLLILLAAVVLGGLAWLVRRSRPPPPEVALDAPPASAEAAAAGLAASLDEVAYEGDDPRSQITAAYRRLLSALATAGAPCEPHEAPHEHLFRVLGPLGVRAEPMHRLAGLYVLAQFSTRPITDRHRAAAAAALVDALVDLHATDAWRSANATGANAGTGAAAA